MSKPRGMIMIGALVQTATGILKIVTGYKCDAACEFVHFAGDSATTWYPLYEYEIVSDGH
jgi:hypothetical protein